MQPPSRFLSIRILVAASRLPRGMMACSAALLLPATAAAQVKVGDQFPSLSEAGLAGPALPEIKGKVVLVDFCASWCAPCKASFPVYSHLQVEYGRRGLVIVAISVDVVASDYAALVRKLHPGFVVLNDARNRLVAAVQPAAMPTSYLLDRTGKVIAIHLGYHSGGTEQELRQELDRILEPAAG